MDIKKGFDLVEIARYLVNSDDFAAYMVRKCEIINDKYNTDIQDLKELLYYATYINKDNFNSYNTYCTLKMIESNVVMKYGEEIREYGLIKDNKIKSAFNSIYLKNKEEESMLILPR